MRILLTLTAAILMAAPAMATKPTPDTLLGGPAGSEADAQETGLFVEENTYRFGQPYRSERGSTAEACAHMCSSDGNCASWSLTPATFQIGPRCELKLTPGMTSYRPGAVSGMSRDLQMDPARDAVMRYEVSVPESRQPEAVPLDQLRPSPVPRTFGEPLEMSTPELLGDRQPQISAIMTAEPAPELVSQPAMAQAPAPSAKPAVIAETTSAGTPVHLDAPVLGSKTPKTPEPIRPRSSNPPATPARAEVPADLDVPIQVTPAAPKMVNAVTKRPAPQTAAAPPSAALVNAVLKREAPQPVAVPAETAAPQPAVSPQTGAPIAFRTPWTERQANHPDYSVEGMDYIPGDEEATAGLTGAGS